MAGIDNNTVLYLKCEDYIDRSLSPKTVTNNNSTLVDGKFRKGIKIASGSSVKIPNGFEGFNLSGDFTIEWWEYSTGSSASGGAFLINRINTASGYKSFIIGKAGTTLFVGSDTATSYDCFNGDVIKDKVDNVWVHWRLVRKGSVWTSYKNGTKFWIGNCDKTIGQSEGNALTFGSYIDSSAVYTGYNAIIDEVRICTYAVCDGDFTPPTQPYSSISINTLSQTATNVNFSVTKLGQEVINKVEVLQDGLVKATHTDSYDNLTYNFIGSNDVTIRVTYDDNYTEEKVVKVGNSKAKIYLYKEGNECTSLTGGFETSKSRGTFSRVGENIITLNASTSSTTSSYIVLKTINKINLSQYNTSLNLQIDGFNTNTSNGYYLIYINDGVSDKDKKLYYDKISTTQNIIHNIPSSIEDGDYIMFGVDTGASSNVVKLDIARIYLETKENVITINSQTQDNITFSANNLGLVTISKIDVLVNGKVSKTYTENYTNLTYQIDKSLLGIGINKIEIRATYSQGDGILETVSEYLTHTYTVDNLPTSSNLIQVFDRQEVLNNSLKLQKDNLRNILSSKNVEVSESDKMSILIDKVSDIKQAKINGQLVDFDMNLVVAGSEWNSISTLPYNFYLGSTVIYNDEIHILGGQLSNTSHYKYSNKSWVSVSTLPYGFKWGSTVVYDNEIHIFGGYDGKTNHYKYDGNSWTFVSTLPYDFYYGSAIVLNNEIHIIGSQVSGNWRKHYKYDGNSWTSVSTLPYDFFEGCSIVYNNEIHILGTSSSTGLTSHYKFNGVSWVSVSTLPYGFKSGSVVVLNNEIHILGSYATANETKHYKYNGSSWTSTSTLPYKFFKGNSIVYNNEILIYGGDTFNYNYAYKNLYKTIN